jgi:hypothetical protein
MKYIFFILTIFTIFSAQSQVGYGTYTPKATLEISSAPNDTTISDGIIAPRLTMDQLLSKTYGPDQTGAIIYITDLTTSTSPLPHSVVHILAIGYYFFNGSQWKTLRSRPGTIIFTAERPEDRSYSIPANQYTTLAFKSYQNVGDGSVDANNYTYTVPMSGRYLVSCSLRVADFSISRDIYMSVGTTLIDDGQGIWARNPDSFLNRYAISYTAVLELKKGDVIQQFVYSPGETRLYLWYNYWALTLLQQTEN